MMVDIHHHVVFGVDDGAPEPEASLAMLREAAKQGIRAIVCTSHDMPGECELDVPRYTEHLEELRRLAAQESIPITLYSGSEILYSPDTVQALREGRVLPLGDTRNVLIEFYPDFPWQLLEKAAGDVTEAGYRMVMAHAERCQCVYDLRRLAMLRQNFGVAIQLNADAVLHSRDLLAGRWVRSVLREELADVVASDAHHPTYRPCRLGDAYALLSRKYGREYADRLCRYNPAALAGV